MFFFFTCGTHTFNSAVKGAEHITVQCQNCGNFSGRVTKRWEWFTFCFIPILPFSLKPHQEVGCHICNFWQDVKYRPDVQQQMTGHAAGHAEQQQPAVMMHGGQGGGHPTPAGVPQYK
ncbi:hypothetical protein P153DRAFT_424049 [Dothidotthia symphoricarpi CBS 119687]|uniref:Zinc-ribbon 15 domain-containing protein n=1 Tax=Dothidotthia symphoricarpi CBS 119687 TaxID=1392245 RepID=A0A6A6ABN5_9PLEO|nr:uncharacterized protein P153DRAFT_424049 [Dothidotthia symphoricarpi CBS 119687]KAF2128121.1 hypothetical protein P153DRAFT_424049 [Dothidotthia symphoricarpi CBS 119687]